MGSDRAVCIDSDGEHSNIGKTASVGQSSKAAVAPLDLCIDSDDDEVVIQDGPVVFVLPSFGTTSTSAVGRSAEAPLQADVAKSSQQNQRHAKEADICIDSDGEFIGSDDDGDEAIGSSSSLLLTVNHQTKSVKNHIAICEANSVEEDTSMPAQIVSKPKPSLTIEMPVRFDPKTIASMPVLADQAVSIPCTPVCEDAEPAKESQRDCADYLLSHQEDPDAKLERQAHEMAEKVLEKLTLAEEVRAKQISKVKDGILKRLKLQQSVDSSCESVGLAAETHVVQPPPPLFEEPSFSPPTETVAELSPDDIQEPAKHPPQQAVFSFGLRDILALAEAQTQAFVERATKLNPDSLPMASQPTQIHYLRNVPECSEVNRGFAIDRICQIQPLPVEKVAEQQETQEPETREQVEPRQSLPPEQLQGFCGQSKALSGSGFRDDKAPLAGFFHKRSALRRLGKTRVEKAKELAGLTGGRHHKRPPVPLPPSKRRKLHFLHKMVHTDEAEEDLETTIANREAEREKRRALLSGSQKRPIQEPSANGWEHRRLRSSAEKRKFLRLMGAAKLAEGVHDDGSGSPLHEADLPMDCPTIELGAEGDWVAVAECSLDGDESSHGGASGAEVRKELEQMFERGLKQTWNKGRGLGA